MVSFIPFPTRLVAKHVRADEPERVATTMYGINRLVASGLVGVLWRYPAGGRLVRAVSGELGVLGGDL